MMMARCGYCGHQVAANKRYCTRQCKENARKRRRAPQTAVARREHREADVVGHIQHTIEFADRPLQSSTASYRLALRRDPCAYCGGCGEHIDHIVPRVRNLDRGWSNLTAACAGCNCSKTAASLLGFLLRRRIDGEIASRRAAKALLP